MITNDTPLKRVINFALDRAVELPGEKRAGMYRDLAIICGDESAARALNELADEVIEIERCHRQLLLRLQ